MPFSTTLVGPRCSGYVGGNVEGILPSVLHACGSVDRRRHELGRSVTVHHTRIPQVANMGVVVEPIDLFLESDAKRARCGCLREREFSVTLSMTLVSQDAQELRRYIREKLSNCWRSIGRLTARVLRTPVL